MTTSSSAPEQTSVPLEKKALRVYMMELWSFIPYYLASLCSNLQGDSVKLVLGSVRYHLDRDYFHKTGLTPDKNLLDFGGAIRLPKLRRAVKIFEYVMNLVGLASRFCVSRPDILHIQYLPFLERGFRFEIWFIRWVRCLGTRIVFTVHNLTPQDTPGRYRILYRSVYRSADALICHGEEARKQLIKDFEIPQEKIWVIPHGPLFTQRGILSSEEARRKLGLPVDKPLVLCAGVISPYKGTLFLLDAWKRLADSGVAARLLVAGTGDSDLLAEIRQKVLSEGMESSVDLWLHFIPVEQLPLLYQAADILVYPYRAGTTSGALLTGMNYAKPIVATTLPFFREYLTDGESAAFVPYGDVSAFSERLADLIRDPLKRERLGRGVIAIQAAQRSWGDIAKATLNCYRTICPVQQETELRHGSYHLLL